jgi:phosphoribosylamine--glycine ligase
MKILVVGSGGREHALAHALHRGGHTVLAAPGNPGISTVARLVPVGLDDLDALVAAAATEDADLVVVGPEAPLAAGLADRLAAAGLRVFGPSADGARIESSKSFAKQVMKRGGVPTPAATVADDLDAGLAAVRAAGGPCVVKADGLAAGKGVVVADTQAEAEAAVRACFEGRFGAAGSRVLVEERLAGIELSLLVLTDGKTVAPLPPAQDHKRIGEGDTGPNTGGMGAYSPVPGVDDAIVSQILDTIVEPTLWALAREGASYCGVLYAGLMLTDAGPKVIEFNCRFGDPEAQAVLPRLGGDVGELLDACAAGALASVTPLVREEAALTVVAAADGYPGKPRTGDRIDGLDDAAAVEGAVVFHAGTATRDGEVVTASGRVLAVTGLHSDLAAARDIAHQALSCISWPGMYWRRDIGHRALGA